VRDTGRRRPERAEQPQRRRPEHPVEPTRPDPGELAAAVEQTNAEVSELKWALSASSAPAGALSDPQTEEFLQRKLELRADLDSEELAIEELQQRKDDLVEGVARKQREKEDTMQQLSELRSSLGFATEDQIDERIAALESQMWSQRLSLAEEKRLLSEIAMLSSKKPQVSQFTRMAASAARGGDSNESLKQKVDEINEQLRIRREEKKSIAQRYHAHIEGMKAIINEKLHERSAVEEEHQRLERRHSAWQARVEKSSERAARTREREERLQARREEEERRQRERQGRVDKAEEARLKKKEELTEKRHAKLEAPDDSEDELLDAAAAVTAAQEPPHFAEVVLLEQTLQFCRSILPREEERPEEKKSVEYNNPEGSVIVIPKEQRGMDFLIPPVKPRRSEAKSMKQREKLKKAENLKTIRHNVHSFSLFEKLMMDAPLSTDDLPATIEKLRDHLDKRRAEIATWEAKRDEARRAAVERRLKRAQVLQLFG